MGRTRVTRGQGGASRAATGQPREVAPLLLVPRLHLDLLDLHAERGGRRLEGLLQRRALAAVSAALFIASVPAASGIAPAARAPEGAGPGREERRRPLSSPHF